MPTGIALRDPREQLFGAAERILDRDGVEALTSRAVTMEAGVAKGVLHRHFADFDDFLAELVVDRVGRLDQLADTLQATAGSGGVAENLTAALRGLFGPVTVAVLALVVTREGLRRRLRGAGASRLPLLDEGTAMVLAYLGAEQALGRVPAEADTATIAFSVIGAAHLLFADREGGPPEDEDVSRIVATVLPGSPSPPRRPRARRGTQGTPRP